MQTKKGFTMLQCHKIDLILNSVCITLKVVQFRESNQYCQVKLQGTYYLCRANLLQG